MIVISIRGIKSPYSEIRFAERAAAESVTTEIVEFVSFLMPVIVLIISRLNHGVKGLHGYGSRAIGGISIRIDFLFPKIRLHGRTIFRQP